MSQRPENRTRPYIPRPASRGPRPGARGPRPNAWVSGTDPVRHEQYVAWSRARAQAHFREEGWELTFDQFVDLWNQDGQWPQRGRGSDDLLMTRKDSSQPWSIENCYIEQRKVHLQKNGIMRLGRPRGKYNKNRKD